MWELPNQEGTWTREQVCQWLAEKGFVANEVKEPSGRRKQLKHIFTHIEWHMTYWMISCNTINIDQDLMWVTKGQFQLLLRRYIRQLWKKMMSTRGFKNPLDQGHTP